MEHDAHTATATVACDSPVTRGDVVATMQRGIRCYACVRRDWR